MDKALDRIDLAPPPQPGLVRGVALAVLAHALLLAALTVGLKWKSESTQLSAEAELWAATQQQAAPRPAPAPPPPPPAPAPVVREQPPPAPTRSQADIALEREKQRVAEERKRQQDAERERQRRAEAEKEEKAEAARKLAAERKRLDEQKQRQAEQARAQAQQQQARAREREQLEARRIEQQREENLRRIQGMAGATGAPSATGTATRSAGPSQSYAGRIRARVKPNIVFTDDLPGNPTTEVEVRMSPDGTITSRRITKASGVKSWDEAVLRALDRTETLPRDVDGRVHSPLFMEFRPKG